MFNNNKSHVTEATVFTPFPLFLPRDWISTLKWFHHIHNSDGANSEVSSTISISSTKGLETIAQVISTISTILLKANTEVSSIISIISTMGLCVPTLKLFPPFPPLCWGPTLQLFPPFPLWGWGADSVVTMILYYLLAMTDESMTAKCQKSR